MRKLESRPWWHELLLRKDDYSLRELAEMFGVTPGAINSALKRNGVERRASPSGPRVRRGRAPASKRMSSPRGRNARQLTEKRLEPYSGQLGRIPDGEIALQAGLSTATVARIRRSRGISPVSRSGVLGQGRSNIALYADLLGQVPDAEIAAMAEVSRAAVRNYRVRRGIPAASRKSSGQASEAGPGPAHRSATAASGSKAIAWQILPINEERTFVVLAHGVAEAVDQAESAGLRVREIRRVAPLF